MSMKTAADELKGCIYANTCKEKHLCCNFCDDKKCWRRCLDNIDTCKYRCELPSSSEEKSGKNKNVDAKNKEV